MHLAYHDTLTDLPNRVLLHDRLGCALLAAERASEPLGLLILDLDGFKAINDSLGHQAGDRVLQELAARLRALLRDGDTVARLAATNSPSCCRGPTATGKRAVARSYGRWTGPWCSTAVRSSYAAA